MPRIRRPESPRSLLRVGWRIVSPVVIFAVAFGCFLAQSPENPDGASGWSFVLLAGVPALIWAVAARGPHAPWVGCGLVLTMVVVIAGSRFQPGAIAPPHWDWMVVFGAVACLIVTVGFVVGFVVEGDQARGATAATGDSARNGAGRRILLATIGAVLIQTVVCCGPARGALRIGDHQFLYVPAQLDELPSLPSGFAQVASRTSCGDDACSTILGVRGPTGVSAADSADRLTDHFRRHGWQTADDGALCRSVGGFLPWGSHSVRVSTDLMDLAEYLPASENPAGLVLVSLTYRT
ncbi:MAG: hypothetical protein HKP61_07500 [Dactylosporangium sp.]|nr:hypothetical protein [Dactylosporangium sp.]